jgi:hypothetical protein
VRKGTERARLFSWEVSARKILKIYHQLLAHAGCHN